MTTEPSGLHLLDGPPELAQNPPVPVRRDPTRLTIAWRGGYEHYELDETASDASPLPVYRWIYRTTIAE